MSRPLISYNGEMMTKKAMIRIFTLANPTLRPIEIQKKILADTGISVADNTVCAIVKTIRGCSAKPKKSQKSRSSKVKTVVSDFSQLQKAKILGNSNVEGLKLLRKSVELLGYANASAYLTIFKD